ncbi:hypothetical protein D2V17_14050 [Aurantiacibacter xanthus]|uniref:Nucleotide modification associated domain-containing protein n=1 Tax=Aurantiacibacter xanthus TaxID=1784712 RepID=A0A3A1P196_9SPHN|nr:hypothetical protein [Aurantiacibacter xanthus]RIV82923.1 hypothetical protein D2V17_14050 [Aurantiacibacter xanthus]
MRIVFSRKGFDSASGGGPSPIVAGRPVTLPIPAGAGLSRTTYGALGLGDHAAKASRGRLGAGSLCHHDPMFLNGGKVLLGQCGAAQTHLANHGVRAGDVFLFFGLFREEGGKPHHRLFGYLRVDEVLPLAAMDPARKAELAALGFPHALALHASSGNDTLYRGRGGQASYASDALRLTEHGASPTNWRVPEWLAKVGLSYHHNPARWTEPGRLKSVARGQEFVADVGERADARRWLEAIVAEMEI